MFLVSLVYIAVGAMIGGLILFGGAVVRDNSAEGRAVIARRIGFTGLILAGFGAAVCVYYIVVLAGHHSTTNILELMNTA